MGTRSAIAISNGTTVQAIYCHWDGHIETNGVTLQEHYQDRDKVEQLIAQGDMSSLGDTIEDTEFYTRDRTEPAEQTRARTYNSIQEMLEEEFEDSDREFVYVYLANDKWTVIDYRTAHSKGAQLLSEAIAEQRREQMRPV